MKRLEPAQARKPGQSHRDDPPRCCETPVPARSATERHYEDAVKEWARTADESGESTHPEAPGVPSVQENGRRVRVKSPDFVDASEPSWPS
jgi:hypothetical protein